jgi:hypothetical protein
MTVNGATAQSVPLIMMATVYSNSVSRTNEAKLRQDGSRDA